MNKQTNMHKKIKDYADWLEEEIKQENHLLKDTSNRLCQRIKSEIKKDKYSPVCLYANPILDFSALEEQAHNKTKLLAVSEKFYELFPKLNPRYRTR